MAKAIVIKEAKEASLAKMNIIERYLRFCDSQMKFKTLWFILPLVIISTAVMPITVPLMGGHVLYAPFIGLSIILFYANLMLSIMGLHTRITISFFIITLLILFAIPLFSVLS